MVMAPGAAWCSRWRRPRYVPHEALAQPAGQQHRAALAVPHCGDCDFLRCDPLGGDIRAGDGAVVGPCSQWSSVLPAGATLVRHILWLTGLALIAGCGTRAPAPGSLRVRAAAAV
jgi:hypothetical protein